MDPFIASASVSINSLTATLSVKDACKKCKDHIHITRSRFIAKRYCQKRKLCGTRFFQWTYLAQQADFSTKIRSVTPVSCVHTVSNAAFKIKLCWFRWFKLNGFQSGLMMGMTGQSVQAV